MLLNFVVESIGTKVSCNKISSDGYECTNLISPDYRCRKRGFLTEHFIKPPVDVTFTFPCHVNICSILLDPFVGQQSSSQLEVYCASRPVPETKHGRKRAEEKKQPGSISEQSPIFYQVSKINVQNQSRIGFCNSRFPSHLSSQQNNMMNLHVITNFAEMRHSKGEILTSATDLTIRISRTKNGSTCALSNLEIWGCVSSRVSDALRKSIHDRFNAFIHPVPKTDLSLKVKEIKSDTFDSKKNESNNEETKKHMKDNIYIPEEFMDPLTCEMMTIPMLLPSGKNVDISTLDKYSDSEASHGRHPRDPFTGVEFYGGVKPVPNGALKARIDNFLLENSHDQAIASLPRTVKSGNSKDPHRKRRNEDQMEISSLVKKSKNVIGAKTEAVHSKNKESDLLEKKSDDQMELAVSTTETRHLAGTSSTSNSSSSANQYLSLSPCDKMKNNFCPDKLNSCLSESSDKSLKVSKAGDEGRTHESCLKNSLDDALSALLGSLSEKSGKNEGLPTSAPPISCFKCKVQLLKDTISYTIPCSHSVCRSCLLDYSVTNKIIQCLICGTKCVKSEAVRTHSINK